MKIHQLLFILALSFSTAATAIAQQEEREEKRARFAKFASKLEPVIKIEKKGAADAALKIYKDWARTAVKGEAMPLPTMAKIYAAAGEGAKAFKTVAYLIKSKAISNDHSVAMAALRESEIQSIINQIGKDKGWKIARSDSGNITSGMKSDLDQTFYLFEPALDKKGKVIVNEDGTPQFQRNPDLDQVFIEEFDRRWDLRHEESGLSRQALDIASIEGKNRFPDPRQLTGSGFWRENRRAAEALRNTPGAYTYAGAVAAQMQFRAMDAILDQNERAYMIFAPDAEGSWDYRGSDADEAVRVMFGEDPELRPGFAFDAALANFLELQHYMDDPKFETKYHLRTWEDSLHSLLLVADGKDRSAKVDLTKIKARERQTLVKKSLETLFAGDAEKQRRHALAMEISAQQRIAHKKEISLVESDLFEAFGREVLGDRWTGSESDIRAARRQYRQTASEFCLESAYHASGESLALLMGDDPKNRLDLEQYRKILGYENRPDGEWKTLVGRLQDATQLTFLFGIYDLGDARARELVSRLAKQHGMRTAPYLFGLWLRGSVQGIESHLREPGRYAAIYADQLSTASAEVSDRVQKHVLSELGFEYEKILNDISGKLDAQALVWKPKKLFTNFALDPGNIDALAQILRVHIESEGDPDAVFAKIVDEFILAIPIAGQIVGATRGGVGGLVVMGAAIAYPPIGAVLLVYSLGEAGYAIYDLEVAAPLAGQLENALYRGYTGPELRFYDKKPPEFTARDRSDLRDHKERLSRERPDPHFRPPFTYDLAALNKARDDHLARQVAYRELLEELNPKISLLEAKKSAWDRYLKDPAAGGFFSGASARQQQRPFGPSLFDAIEPLISFSPYGLIDFSLVPDEKSVARWEEALSQAVGAEEKIRAEQALRIAEEQLARAQRALRYRERALGRTEIDGDRFKKDPQTSLELRHKIRRDSLYPGLLALGYDDPDAYFTDWLAANPKVLDRLVQEGFLEYDEGVEWQPSYPRPIPVYTRRSDLPAEAKTKILERFRSDFQRSKVLWDSYREAEKNRRLKEEQDLQRRLAAFEGGAAAIAVNKLIEDPELGRLYETIRNHRPEPDPGIPIFEGTVYQTEEGLGCSFTVRADPLEYPPPYQVKIQAFSPRAIWNAAQRGSAGPFRLTPSARATIKKHFNNRPPKKDSDESADFYVLNAVDAEGDTVGQSLSFGPREVESTSCYILTSWAETDKEARDNSILGRFPDFRGRFTTNLGSSAYSLARAQYLPVIYEVDEAKVSELIAAHESELPLDISEAVRPYRGDFRGSFLFAGRRQYFTRNSKASRLPTIAVPTLLGCRNGQNRIQVEVALPDGQRLQRSFDLEFSMTTKPEELRRQYEIVREVEAKHAAEPNHYTIRDMASAYRWLAIRLRENEGSVQDITAAVRKMAQNTLATPNFYKKDKLPLTDASAMGMLDKLAAQCLDIGTPEACSLLMSTFKAFDSERDWKKAPQGLKKIELAIAKLIILSRGDLKAARPHWERGMVAAPFRQTPAEALKDIENYWPKGPFWD